RWGEVLGAMSHAYTERNDTPSRLHTGGTHPGRVAAAQAQAQQTVLAAEEAARTERSLFCARTGVAVTGVRIVIAAWSGMIATPARDTRKQKATRMGYGISLHRFADGEPETLDERMIRQTLAPCAVDRGEHAGEMLIRAVDGGETEVNVSADGISVHRFPTGGAVDVVAELANLLGAAVLLPDGALVSSEEQRANLPDGLRDTAAVIEMTGPALRAALRA
ncbi:hypothetical protein, partial [Streptomyces clavuligerus]